jgi:hypothetical protein
METHRLRGTPKPDFKTEKCPVRIGQSLELAPLSHDEKTSLWNQNAGFGPFGEPQVMDRGDLAQAQFVFRSSSTTGRDNPGFGPEFRDEIARVVTAMRNLSPGFHQRRRTMRIFCTGEMVTDHSHRERRSGNRHVRKPKHGL